MHFARWSGLSPREVLDLDGGVYRAYLDVWDEEQSEMRRARARANR